MITSHVWKFGCIFAGKFALSGKKKEKNKGKLVPDNFALGAIVWRVQVRDCSCTLHQ